ncbi:uncharacterized protein EI97DRAFT_112322 [Westerdykella ornata]|uniref:Uncharacterized protein n=1 Tax=Westerdykella ornata TaxID=318751 RepID=A0A6A6JVL5_WESOR|nr:uncharacterized protein EI97DRAFT_112322 [Westerdykella ornata]KAF2280143.1 hypothetical protein EI97DRAFT_112322 [Westerdykella ornata]
MAGRKDKHAGQQAPKPGEPHAGGSNIRRKLSYGFSLISNSLGQRKVTAGRGPRSGEEQHSASLHQNIDRQGDDSRSLLSPPFVSSSQPLLGSLSPNKRVNSQVTDPELTPKPLPRSRTVSHIPRPPVSDSAAFTSKMSSTEPDRHSSSRDSSVRVSATKIPTPSPPPGNPRRLASPRQCTSAQHTVQQEKHIAAGAAFAGLSAKPALSTTSRSYTTPNLRKTSIPVGQSFMMPRKSAMKARFVAPSAIQHPSNPMSILKENTPTTQTERGSASQRPINKSIREGFVSQKKQSPRRSPSSNNSPGHKGKQAATTTASSSPAKRSNTVGGTPATVKRVPGSTQPAQSSIAYRTSNANRITQPRLLGPVNPPTPTPTESTSLSSFPRSSTDSGYSRRTLHSRMNSTFVSRGLVGSRGEVRIPRSSTFHHFPRHETPPPMPPIPEKYKTPPKSVVDKVDLPHDYTVTETLDNTSKALPQTPQKASGELIKREDSSTFITDPDSSVIESTDEDLMTLLAQKEARTGSAFVTPPRPFSPNNDGGSFANITASLQVKEYMPAVWWAGRFQTRLDQWRTDAMRASMEPDFQPEGLLGGYKLDEERMAACYIFLQLRDLCATKEAADSLWEFEYKYRQENKLLGTMIKFPAAPSHKQPETEASKQGQGPIGRAMRKMTPRNSSFVSLLKGKGRNAGEETNPDCFVGRS